MPAGRPADMQSLDRFDGDGMPLYAGLMPVEFLLSAAVTLFIVVDPLGLAPAFVALTDGDRKTTNRRS